VQLEKAEASIEETPSGIVTDVNPVHPENASLLIEVTLLGIVIDVNPMQSTNALSLIVVTLDGNDIDVSREHLKNMYVPIVSLDVNLDSKIQVVK